MKILIVPARSGSKRIKNKNIKIVNKLPMMIHSMKIAKATKIFDKIHLSTDSLRYIKIAKQYGFNTDFKRKRKFCSDKTPVLDAVKSDLIEFKNRGYRFNEICVLSATSPLITHKDILKTRKIFLKFNKKHPVISSAKFPAKIERAMKMVNGKIKFIKKLNINKKTQNFSDSFFPTGNIFYYNPKKLLKSKKYSFDYIPYMIETFRAIDIDDESDLKLIKKIL